MTDLSYHEGHLTRTADGSPDDYGISHRPLHDGAPAHDLSQGYAEDVYTHPQHYAGIWPAASSAEGLAQLRRVRGKPDAPVTIYRATGPGTPREMNHGDWVTLSRSYAHQMAWSESGDDRPENQWHVHKAVVPAQHVRDAGTDQYREQGYWGPGVKSERDATPRHRPWEFDAALAKTDKDDQMREAEDRLSRALSGPSVPRQQSAITPHENLYGGHIEQHPAGGLTLHGEPVSKLYRIADPGEWEEAQRNGYLQSRGGYTRASAAPDERWRHQGDAGVQGYTLEIDYHPDDQWGASAEGYAATRSRIPLSRIRRTAALHGRDELPPDPGTAQIPHGHVRLWHYTSLENADSIREHGLQRKYARGDAGDHNLDDPSAGVWASTKRPDDILNAHSSHAAVVEYHAHPSEISGQAEEPWHAYDKSQGGYDNDKVQDWAKGYHHVIMRGDVHPSQIVAVHEPWHGAARYMRDDPAGPDSYNWIREEHASGANDALEPYVRGLDALQKRAARTRAPSVWYHGTSKDLQPGDVLRPGAEIGEQAHSPQADDQLWLSSDPWRASAYGHRTYEVQPHTEPRPHHRGSDEHTADAATVVREISDAEARELSPAYQEGARAYERQRRHAAAGHLPNPLTGGSEWFHGTQAHQEDLKKGFVDPASVASTAYEMPQSEGDDTGHWNRLLGTHFTADHHIASEFARGEHQSSDNDDYGGREDDPEEHQGVVHARLGIKNPKVYASEHDMDHEAYEHEHAAGNHPINHLRDYENDDEYGDEQREEEWPHAMQIHRDYGEDKIPAGTYGRYMTPFEQHPMRTAWLNTHPDKFDIAARFKKRLEDQGHDGVIYRNEYEKSSRGAAANTSAIAFHPHQAQITDHHQVDEPCSGGQHHQGARMPYPDYDPAEKMPVGRGIWYRAHVKGQPLDAEHARSEPLHGPVVPGGQRGYSAVRTPHQLGRYMDQMGWIDAGQAHGRDVLAFHGHETGRGADNEPLVVPQANPACCGQIVHSRHSWGELESHIWGEDNPEVPRHMEYVRDPAETEAGSVRRNRYRHAAWMPRDRIFGRTYGLDRRLFRGRSMRSRVRRLILDRLNGVLEPLLGAGWQDFTRVYLAGSEASEWTGPDREGNGDFDTLLGFDFARLRQEVPGLADRTDLEICDQVNNLLKVQYNESHWHPAFLDEKDRWGREWDITGFANSAAWDITEIRPYAAYDITSDSWAVRPPHLPHWDSGQFPEGPAIFQAARALIGLVRATLMLPEPFRTQQARGIWHYIHEGRTQDFSMAGLGWQGPGNVLEKALDQAPGQLVDRLKAVVHGEDPAQLYGPDGTHTAALISTAAEPWTYYHGTPDERTWDHGADYGIHIGTQEAARQALHARIGRPAEGEWDGTREYGRTPLNRDVVHYDHDPETRTWTARTEHREPTLPGGTQYSDGSKVPADARPNIFPVRIKGLMTNHPATPHEDFHANGYMRGQIKRGRAKSGYYYKNVSEDEGSISAVVPSAAHLERADLEHAGRSEHTAATEKPSKSKAQVNYRPADGPHRCGNCVMFGLHPPDFEAGACTLVKGLIDESDTCDEWSPARKGKTAAFPGGSTEGMQGDVAGQVEWVRQHGQPHRAFNEHVEEREYQPGEHSGPFLHGSINRIEPGQVISHDAPPEGHGRLQHSFFTTDPEVAQDAADPRDGLGHGWVHVVEPTGPYHVDHGEPSSWKSAHPLRVVSVEPGRYGPRTPHPPMWGRTAAFEDASEENRAQRLHRVKNWVGTQPSVGPRSDALSIPEGHGNFDPHRIQMTMFHHDPGDLHWHHVPHQEVDLRQKIHYGQPTVDRDVMRAKIKEHEPQESHENSHWNDLGDDFFDRDEHDQPDEPLFVKHEGEMHLVDGHHRFERARLLGQQSMWGHVYDTSDSAQHPDNCYECKEHKRYCSDCGGDDESEGESSGHVASRRHAAAETLWHETRATDAELPEEIHRGLPVQFSPEDHAFIHDESRPAHERAQRIMDTLDARDADLSKYGDGWIGRHWSTSERSARSFATRYDSTDPYAFKPDERATRVVLHARTPARSSLIRGQRALDEHAILPFAHGEQEVPVRRRSVLHLNGISWGAPGKSGDPMTRHDFPEPLRRKAAAEGYTTCDRGHQHWGRHGAAGLLIRHRGEDGQTRYLLQKRAPWVQEGGTWSTPGGALHPGEPPATGARREAEEELGDLGRLRHSHTVTDDHGGWAYHTVVADAPHQIQPGGNGTTQDETDGHGWFTAAEMKDLPLHSGFAKSWDTVRRSRTDKTAAARHPQEFYDAVRSTLTGMSPADRQFFEDAISHLQRGAPASEPINAEDAAHMARGFRTRDRLKDAGFDTSPSEGQKYPRGVSIRLPEGHGATLSPNEPHGWHVRTYHLDDHFAPHIHHDLPDSDEDFPQALHRYYAHPGIQGQMAEQRAAARMPGKEASLDPAADAEAFRRHMIEMHGKEDEPGLEHQHERHAQDHEDMERAQALGIRLPAEFVPHSYEETAHEQRRGRGRLPDAAHSPGFIASRTAGASTNTGMMVALVPADHVKDHLQQVMEPLKHEAEPRDQLHVTVLYLGKTTQHTQAELDKLPELVRLWAKTQEPFTASVQGSGTFANSGEHPLLALVDIPGEARHMHHSLAEFLKGHGIEFPENHSWIPHVTLAYSPHAVRFMPKIERHEWPVTEVHYVQAGDWHAIPLGR